MLTLPPRILVLGMGRSGEAVMRFLASRRDGGDDLTFALLDEGAGPELESRAAALGAETGAEVSLAESKAAGEWDLVIASPGIPPRSPLMRSARALGAPVISEIELAWRVSDVPWAAVTGTNGKTTTTALLAHLLRAAGIEAQACGNIGAPAITAAASSGPDTVLVAEVSSFQLALTERFRPRVAVLLNITPDHADWHGSPEAYEADKVRVFANMAAGDTAVIDVDDAGSAAWADRVAARGAEVVPVSVVSGATSGAWLRDDVLTVMRKGVTTEAVSAHDLQIRGRHNVSNALAAAAAALAMGATPDGVRAGLRSFEPMPHRLEPVGSADGVDFCNDSKATNPDAVLKALTAFDGRESIVLLGGRNKGSDFGELARAVTGRCRLAVLFGESLPQLRDAFAVAGGATVEASGLAQAVEAAVLAARSGDVVLLSPACASFDEFRSFEHRGAVFRDLVAAGVGGASGRAGAGR